MDVRIVWQVVFLQPRNCHLYKRAQQLPPWLVRPEVRVDRKTSGYLEVPSHELQHQIVR